MEDIMTTPLDRIQVEFDELVVKYQEAIADGKLSFSDAMGLLLHGAFSIATVLQGYVELDFEKRKAVGIDLCTQFYEKVIEPIDLPIPDFIEVPLDKTLKMIVPTLIGSVYDAIDTYVYKKLD